LQLASAAAIDFAVDAHVAVDDGLFHVAARVEEPGELEELPETDDLTTDRDVVDGCGVGHSEMLAHDAAVNGSVDGCPHVDHETVTKFAVQASPLDCYPSVSSHRTLLGGRPHGGILTSRALTTVLSIAVVLALGGCATVAPTTAAAPTTHTPKPSATPTPKPSPTPTQNPADPSTWILSFDEVGGIQVGQSPSALATAAGLVPVEDTFDCPPGYWTKPDPAGTDLTVTLMQDDARGTALPDPKLTYASFRILKPQESVVPTSPSTPAGIRIGSTEAALLAAYPSIQKTVSKYDDSAGLTTYAVGPSSGRYLVFQVGVTSTGARTIVDMLSTTRNIVIDVCD